MSAATRVPMAVEKLSLAPARGGVLRRCGGHRCLGGCEDHERPARMLHRSGGHDRLAAAPPIVREVLASSGRPLDGRARAFAERGFGHDFTSVRVYTDERAAESADALGAVAYTVGRDVVFGRGQYAPDTTQGRQTLAHELAHVLQQPAAPATSRIEIGAPDDLAEVEAERVATEAVRHGFGDGEDALQASPASSGLTSSPLPSPAGSGPAKLRRTISYASDCDPDRREVEGNVSRAQASAIRWAQVAIAALAEPESVAGLLRRHFHVAATDRAFVTTIKTTFETMVRHLQADAFTYYCGGMPSVSGCRQKRCDSRTAGRACQGEFWISFCDPFPYQNFFGHRDLIYTLLHEAAHAHSASFNQDSYEPDSDYPGPAPLTNADSYSSFAREAALGRLDPTLELSLGSLVAAEPQFYLSAGLSGDIGGPALDLFNLRLGLRVGFTPRTGAQPTRGILAADLGLRVAPIRPRVYVDVATGAFTGVNFTDD